MHQAETCWDLETQQCLKKISNAINILSASPIDNLCTTETALQMGDLLCCHKFDAAQADWPTQTSILLIPAPLALEYHIPQPGHSWPLQNHQSYSHWSLMFPKWVEVERQPSEDNVVSCDTISHAVFGALSICQCIIPLFVLCSLPNTADFSSAKQCCLTTNFERVAKQCNCLWRPLGHL